MSFRISTKGRYALRMLIDLERHKQEGYISLNEVASRENISKKYLEQIVSILNHAGILVSNRGFQGGYRLAKDANKITVYDVLLATEVDLTCVDCQKKDHPCQKRFLCPTYDLWRGLDDMVHAYFSKITIQDLLDSKED